MPPLDPQTVVDTMTDVQKLVHLAARMDSVHIEDWRTQFLRQRRNAYEDELSIQARRVGCSGRRGRLGNGDILSQLNDLAGRDAQSIANTYNYYLANAIINISQESPRANRYVYAKRIQEWEVNYWKWKQPQVDQVTDNESRALAQQHFYQYNNQMGSARLLPVEAVCPVCQGWVRRGVVPLRVALNNPPPYHMGCPHIFDVRPDQVPESECPMLWLGS